MNKTDARRLRRRLILWGARGAACMSAISGIAPFMRHRWVDLVALLLCLLGMVTVVRMYYISRRLSDDDDTEEEAGP